MLGHIGLNVPDLEIAREYYADLMPRLGFESFLDDTDQFAFMPAGGTISKLVYKTLPRERFVTACDGRSTLGRDIVQASRSGAQLDPLICDPPSTNSVLPVM